MDAGQIVSETRQHIISHEGWVGLFGYAHIDLLVVQDRTPTPSNPSQSMPPRSRAVPNACTIQMTLNPRKLVTVWTTSPLEYLKYPGTAPYSISLAPYIPTAVCGHCRVTGVTSIQAPKRLKNMVSAYVGSAACFDYDTTCRAMWQSSITLQPKDLFDRCFFGQDVHDT